MKKSKEDKKVDLPHYFFRNPSRFQRGVELGRKLGLLSKCQGCGRISAFPGECSTCRTRADQRLAEFTQMVVEETRKVVR